MMDMKAPSVSDTSPKGLRADTSPASQGRIIYVLPRSSIGCGGGVAAKSATEGAFTQ